MCACITLSLRPRKWIRKVRECNRSFHLTNIPGQSTHRMSIIYLCGNTNLTPYRFVLSCFSRLVRRYNSFVRLGISFIFRRDDLGINSKCQHVDEKKVAQKGFRWSCNQIANFLEYVCSSCFVVHAEIAGVHSNRFVDGNLLKLSKTFSRDFVFWWILNISYRDLTQ